MAVCLSPRWRRGTNLPALISPLACLCQDGVGLGGEETLDHGKFGVAPNLISRPSSPSFRTAGCTREKSGWGAGEGGLGSEAGDGGGGLIRCSGMQVPLTLYTIVTSSGTGPVNWIRCAVSFATGFRQGERRCQQKNGVLSRVPGISFYTF